MLGFSLPSHYGRTITTGRSNWSTMNPMRRISARLSKAYLKGDGNLAPLVFRPKAFFSEQRIELIPAKAEAIDRGKKRFVCPPELSFSMGIWCWRLVLAIGSFGHPMKRGASITSVRSRRRRA